MGYHKFKIFRASELARRGNIIAATGLGLASLRSLTASGFGIGAVRHQIARYRATQPTDNLLARLASGGSLPQLSRGRHEPLWQHQLRDVTALSLPTLLRYEDRNSMGCSVESRLPFVDYRVVEFGLALPEEVKLRQGYGKWIVREAMKGRIPDSIRTARWKRGFDANHGYAIASGLGNMLRSRLLEAEGELTRLIDVPLNVNSRYSDDRLIEDRSAFGEAVALIWLGQRLGGHRTQRFPGLITPHSQPLIGTRTPLDSASAFDTSSIGTRSIGSSPVRSIYQEGDLRVHATRTGFDRS